jgi:fatty acid desaturase
MATAISAAAHPKSLQDPELRQTLHQLRKTDNLTNWLYLLRTYLYFILVIGGAVWFFEYQVQSGLSFWWNVPVALVAIVLVGAGQHQLSGLAHEASHHILFRNRYLNDLAGDWLTMFPMFSTLYHYRLQHHAHHQFVNDPQRDPDVSQLQTSGHWLPFPLSKRAFLLTLLKQLWVPNLIRFIRIRAKYNSVGTDKNPYFKKGWKPDMVPILLGMLYLLGLIVLLRFLVVHGDPLLLAIVPWAPWLCMMLYYYFLPDGKYHQSRVRPLIHLRWTTMGRVTLLSLVFNALAWITLLTGSWAGLYFAVLWIVPLLTSFSFFMILRQLVQHGNGGRGRLTNTRVFLVNRFINFAVFPMGQDYHLPHHMYASIPHYRLKELHEALLEYPEYRDSCVVVDGYFLPRHKPPIGPTVLEVVGPDYTPHAGDVHIDNSVLEDDHVEEKEAILREGEEEKRRAPA